MSVAAVDAPAVGDEIVGVVLVVDAAVLVDVTVVDAAVTAAAVACAVDAVPVVADVNAAAVELQTFLGDAASVAGQQVNRFDCP